MVRMIRIFNSLPNCEMVFERDWGSIEPKTLWAVFPICFIVSMNPCDLPNSFCASSIQPPKAPLRSTLPRTSSSALAMPLAVLMIEFPTLVANACSSAHWSICDLKASSCAFASMPWNISFMSLMLSNICLNSDSVFPFSELLLVTLLSVVVSTASCMGAVVCFCDLDTALDILPMLAFAFAIFSIESARDFAGMTAACKAFCNLPRPLKSDFSIFPMLEAMLPML